MSELILKLLMPRLSPEMSSEDRDKFFAVLDHMFKVELFGGGEPCVFWAHTQRGRYRQAGRQTFGENLQVVGYRFSRQEIAWMCVTRQIVFARSTLLSRRMHVRDGTGINHQDLRTWRFYPDRRILKTVRSPRQVGELPYIDWQGVQHNSKQP